MCCLFGFVDYAGSLSTKQKNRLIRELSIAAEARGTDATGIAYNTSRGLQIYKRPLAAHRLHLRIPAEIHSWARPRVESPVPVKIPAPAQKFGAAWLPLSPVQKLNVLL